MVSLRHTGGEGYQCSWLGKPLFLQQQRQGQHQSAACAFPHEYDILRGNAGFQERGIGGQTILQRGRPQIFRGEAVVEGHAVIAVVGGNVLADCPTLPRGADGKSAAVNVENRSLLISGFLNEFRRQPVQFAEPDGHTLGRSWRPSVIAFSLRRIVVGLPRLVLRHTAEHKVHHAGI